MTQGRKGSPSKGSKMSFKRSGKMISEGSQMDAEALERKMLMKQVSKIKKNFYSNKLFKKKDTSN